MVLFFLKMRETCVSEVYAQQINTVICFYKYIIV